MKNMKKLKEQIMSMKRIYLVLAGAVIVLLIACITIVLLYQNALRPVSSKSKEVQFEIKEAETMDSVLTRLEEEGIIKSAAFAKWYVKFHDAGHIKAGTFVLDTSWDTAEVLAYLNDANAALAKQATITLPEGIWAKEIAAKISEETSVSKEELLALWNDETFLKKMIEQYDFLDESILNDAYRVKLEGYLYPETYSFLKESSAEEITVRLLDEFDKIYQEYRKDFEKSSLSTHEIVILASMIQFEASKAEDMYLVSGVFYNRLGIDMPLQSSVTVCYALYDDFAHASDCETNADIDSPYNTYQHNGLPIGPILNPGKVAIDAALHPQESDYLYFIADIYGDGTLYYAKTFEEHSALVAKYLNQ